MHEPMTWEEFGRRPSAPPGVVIDREDRPGAAGELRLPEGPGPHPVAVVVHGGCWSSMAGPAYMSRVAAAITGMGWATWLPSFLRVDDAGGAWPGMLEDVGRALDRLRDFGSGHGLDLRRTVTVGHSSGGHLALWLAARPSLPDAGDGARLRGPDPLRPAGVVGLAPITDLSDFHIRPDRGCPRTAVSDLLGGDPADRPERRDLADPARHRRVGVPRLLVSGELDRTVPTAHVTTRARAATARGDVVETLEVEGAGHFELVEPEHVTWSERTGPAIADFLARVPPID